MSIFFATLIPSVTVGLLINVAGRRMMSQRKEHQAAIAAAWREKRKR